MQQSKQRWTGPEFPRALMTGGACESGHASKGMWKLREKDKCAKLFLNERKGKWGSSRRTFLTPASSCQSKTKMNVKDPLFSNIHLHKNQYRRRLGYFDLAWEKPGKASVGRCGPQQEFFESGPEFTADQAIEHWVEATVCVGQTHSQRESVCLGIVECLAEGHQVELNKDAPQSQGLIGQPTQEERQDNDHNRFGDLRATLVPPLLTFGASHAANPTA